jgi:hypothetical protein
VSTDVERFMTHVKVLSDGCWEWTGSTNDQGYATFFVDGKSRRAFRWIIGQLREPVPEGLEPDHVCHSGDATCAGGAHCRHRRCVNPDHGEAVTHAENSRRAAYRVLMCSEGHPLPEVDEGRRVCRECANRRNREYKARRRMYDAIMGGAS